MTIRNPKQGQTRIEIFDAHAEKQSGRPVKVAEVRTDGARGQVDVLDEKMGGLVKDLFERPVQATPSGGGRSRRGLFADAAPKALAPYSDAAVQHLVKHELPIHKLRAELAKLDREGEP